MNALHLLNGRLLLKLYLFQVEWSLVLSFKLFLLHLKYTKGYWKVSSLIWNHVFNALFIINRYVSTYKHILISMTILYQKIAIFLEIRRQWLVIFRDRCIFSSIKRKHDDINCTSFLQIFFLKSKKEQVFAMKL